jgi:hypothetical protein
LGNIVERGERRRQRSGEARRRLRNVRRRRHAAGRHRRADYVRDVEACNECVCTLRKSVGGLGVAVDDASFVSEGERVDDGRAGFD